MQLNNIPQTLKDLRRWVVWRDEDGRKIPYRCDGGLASSTNSEHWASFDAVCAEFLGGNYTGVGFVFGPDDGLCGVDLDDCLDGGKLAPWAEDILATMPTYAEISPSGKGLKLFCRGKIPGDGSGRKTQVEGGAVEVYQQGRYFTVTGDAFGELRGVADCGDAVGELWQRYFGGETSSGALLPEPTKCDATPEEIAETAAMVPTLPEAIEGQGGSNATVRAGCEIRRRGVYGDAGRALLGLYNQTRCHPPWDDRELDRKWDAARKFVAPRFSEFEPVDDGKADGFSLELRSLREFLGADLRQTFIVDGVLVDGQHTVIGGPKKALKTTLALDLSIAVATGKPFCGHAEFATRSPRPVMVISGESGGPTLQNACKRICDARGVVPHKDAHFISLQLPQFSLPHHLAEVRREIESREVGLCIVDPAYLCVLGAGGADDAKNVFAMGRVLRGFGQIGTDTGCTMALVHHARKQGQKAEFRALDLDDLTYSGFAEWARQWLLIGRRANMSKGRHQLWLTIGGSAGHHGQYALDVDEGQPDDPLIGRHWSVDVLDADEIAAKEQAEKDAAADSKFDDDCRRVLAELQGEPLPVAWSRLGRQVFNSGNGRIDMVANHLISEGKIEKIEKGGKRFLQVLTPEKTPP